MRKLKMMIVATFALGASVAFADKLSDFKDAVSAANAGKGCESIPYSDYRSSCRSEQDQMHDWCDGRKGPVTCGSQNISRQAKDNVEKEKKAVETLKKKKSKLESDKSNAKTDDDKNKIAKEIEQVDKDIYEGNKKIDQAQKDFETRKKLVEDAIYTLDKCIAYRRAVMNSFAAALDKVRNEKRDAGDRDACQRAPQQVRGVQVWPRGADHRAQQRAEHQQGLAAVIPLRPVLRVPVDVR